MFLIIFIIERVFLLEKITKGTKLYKIYNCEEIIDICPKRLNYSWILQIVSLIKTLRKFFLIKK